MMKDEYKLVPKKEITDMKKEVEDLRKALMQRKVKTKEPISSKNLKKSMDNLSDSINELVNLFTVAKDMDQKGAFEESKQQATAEMQSLVEQNKAIAKGILAITEMLSEYLPKLTNIARETPRYKLLRVKKDNSILSKPKTPSRMPMENFARSELPSMPEVDDDFEFPKKQEDDSEQG
ncbi:MAG: hypothetical protein KKA61_01420 [Nanoarchaeota archaeon]|nr:hypothetical protein [Nanoarchaeota archaeon]